MRIHGNGLTRQGCIWYAIFVRRSFDRPFLFPKAWIQKQCAHQAHQKPRRVLASAEDKIKLDLFFPRHARGKKLFSACKRAPWDKACAATGRKPFFSKAACLFAKTKNFVRIQPVKPTGVPKRMKFFSHVSRPGPRVKSACAVLAQGHFIFGPLDKNEVTLDRSAETIKGHW